MTFRRAVDFQVECGSATVADVETMVFKDQMDYIYISIRWIIYIYTYIYSPAEDVDFQGVD